MKVSLLGGGYDVPPRKDAWSMVLRLKQATSAYTTSTHSSPETHLALEYDTHDAPDNDKAKIGVWRSTYLPKKDLNEDPPQPTRQSPALTRGC